MMSKRVKMYFCAIYVYMLLTIAVATNTNDISDDTDDVLSRVMKALHGALDSMERNLDCIVIDAQYGSRQVQAQTKILLDKMENEKISLEKDNIRNKIQSLHEKARRVGDKQEKSIIMNDQESYTELGKFSDQQTPDKFLRRLQCPGADYAKNFSVTVGAISDECFREILHATPPCHISDECWDVMTKTNTISTIQRTHQVIFLEMVKNSVCLPYLEARAKKNNVPTIQELENMICCRIKEDADEGDKTPRNTFFLQDTLEEQITICGSSGFLDFAKKEWLDKLLSWQSLNGCYPDFAALKIRIDPPKSCDGDTRRRHKRSDFITKDLCSQHSTSVATGALAFFFRIMVEDMMMME